LAQIRKLDTFLSIQRKNHSILKDILSEIPEITFRRVPDQAGDSCTFLSWFLPTEALTKAVIAEMKLQNILAGNFYWYDNNWHYIRKWAHLKNADALNTLSNAQHDALIALQEKDFSASDNIMQRCISTSISLMWTEEQLKEKGEKIKAVIQKVLSLQEVTV
jgi:8-amino-3,8-dideoxy-alpha-D-manno-octulosonate transaminase